MRTSIQKVRESTKNNVFDWLFYCKSNRFRVIFFSGKEGQLLLMGLHRDDPHLQQTLERVNMIEIRMPQYNCFRFGRWIRFFPHFGDVVGKSKHAGIDQPLFISSGISDFRDIVLTHIKRILQLKMLVEKDQYNFNEKNIQIHR